jgi:NADH-quinone oxidoreductase subunit M
VVRVALVVSCLVVALAAGAAHARELGPRLRLEPASLTFERPGEKRAITLRNVGGQVLRISQVKVWHADAQATDFAVDPVQFQALAPGGSLVVNVSYRPTGPAARAGITRQSFGAVHVINDDPTLRFDPGARPAGNVATVALRAGAGPPWLSWIVFFPLLALPLLFAVPRGRERLVRWIALAASLVPLALALHVFRHFDRTLAYQGGNHGLQFIEHVTWIRGFNVEYFLAVDGLSVTMLVLSTLIGAIAAGASWSIPLDRHIRGYFAMLLLLEVGMAGVFVALDFFLFYVFWEVMLLPMYFLVGIWGGPRKEYAAIKFFLYTLLGAVLMLLGIIALYYASKPGYLIDGTPAAHTFDMLRLAHGQDWAAEKPILGHDFSRLVWLAFFVAFAIKVPIVPLHTWLPDAHVEAPTAISVVLAGILLKTGTYGLLRVNWAMLPAATHWAAHAVAWLAVVSVLYGALCAMAQKDLKRLVAYSSIGHMGFCLLGMAALTETGISGALLQMFNHGTITAMLFLLVGVLYDRTHTRGLDEFGGVASVMPRYAALFGLAFMASLGLPGLSGFVGEVLVFIGAFPVWRGLVIAAGLSLVLTAAYHLIAIERIQLGTFNERWRSALAGHDLDGRELATLLPLAVLVVVLGFYPMPILGAVATAVKDLVAVVGGGP